LQQNLMLASGAPRR